MLQLCNNPPQGHEGKIIVIGRTRRTEMQYCLRSKVNANAVSVLAQAFARWVVVASRHFGCSSGKQNLNGKASYLRDCYWQSARLSCFTKKEFQRLFGLCSPGAARFVVENNGEVEFAWNE